jgi:hypothetical protein
MLQLLFQAVDAGEVSPEFPFNSFNFRVPGIIVRHAANPAFGVRLQFILERAQDFQGRLNFLIGHDFRFGCRVAGLAHVHSSSQIESAMVYQLHNMRAQSM